MDQRLAKFFHQILLRINAVTGKDNFTVARYCFYICRIGFIVFWAFNIYYPKLDFSPLNDFLFLLFAGLYWFFISSRLKQCDEIEQGVDVGAQAIQITPAKLTGLIRDRIFWGALSIAATIMDVVILIVDGHFRITPWLFDAMALIYTGGMYFMLDLQGPKKSVFARAKDWAKSLHFKPVLQPAYLPN